MRRGAVVLPLVTLDAVHDLQQVVTVASKQLHETARSGFLLAVAPANLSDLCVIDLRIRGADPREGRQRRQV